LFWTPDRADNDFFNKLRSSRKSAKARYDIALRPGGRGIQRGTVRRYSA
jgi:hypothetical protein